MNMKTFAPTTAGVIIVLCVCLGIVSCEPFGGGGGGGGGSNVPRTLDVRANRESGTRFEAPTAGTYAFTITGGAYAFTTPGNEWFTLLKVYVNSPIIWSGEANPVPVGSTTQIGSGTGRASKADAEAAGVGGRAQFSLDEGGYVILVVPGRQGQFGDNTGSVNVFVEQVQ